MYFLCNHCWQPKKSQMWFSTQYIFDGRFISIPIEPIIVMRLWPLLIILLFSLLFIFTILPLPSITTLNNMTKKIAMSCNICCSCHYVIILIYCHSISFWFDVVMWTIILSITEIIHPISLFLLLVLLWLLNISLFGDSTKIRIII